MSDRVVIDGDMSLTSTIDGEGSAVIRLGQNPVIEPLSVTENGTYEVQEGVDGFNPVTVALPEYEGAYTVEPSAEEQTLATAGKVMAQDVTVGKVEPVFWKSVTLEEDHTKSEIGNPVYWFDFFGIPREDMQNGWVYEVYVENNETGNYYLLWLRYASKPNIGTANNGVHAIYVRGQGASTHNGSNYYLFAVKGTVFNIYRYKTI